MERILLFLVGLALLDLKVELLLYWVMCAKPHELTAYPRGNKGESGGEGQKE